VDEAAIGEEVVGLRNEGAGMVVIFSIITFTYMWNSARKWGSTGRKYGGAGAEYGR